MTQVSVMELAKQGDPHAIAALINRSLESKGIHAQAQLDNECLKISLQASQVPNQKAVVTIIHRGMMILQIPQIKRVKVLTYRSDNNYLAWQHEFSLSNHNPAPSPQSLESQSSEPKPSASKSSDLVQEQNRHLVDNYQGAILVQKLSQIQQNLQEYQDVIVRFTDEHVGTVRCLTTLTELIQVISKPSFLFAAVASNPSLRSLLDTIAEFSKTDEHGDQVITNLSILQPGQQWQKAKIRLVSKIFLEPAQDTTNVENKHQGITLDLDKTPHEPVGYSILDTSESTSPISESPNINPSYDLSAPSSESLFDNFTEASAPEHIPESIDSPASVSASLATEELVAESLFDDFAESDLPDDTKTSPELEVVESVSPPNTVESLFDEFPVTTKQNVIEAPPSVNTTESLFDDFPDSDTSDVNVSDLSIDVETPKATTQSVNTVESLFDDFMDTSISDASSDYAGISSLDESVAINLPEVQEFRQVDDQTDSFNTDESDLFSGFSIDQSPKSRLTTSAKIDNVDTPDNLDAIKSMIPKQNLENLLKLMDEQAQTPIEVPLTNEQTNEHDQTKNTDLGATTIERILGGMETLVLNGDGKKLDPDFVTLENFADDLDSLGF